MGRTWSSPTIHIRKTRSQLSMIMYTHSFSYWKIEGEPPECTSFRPVWELGFGSKMWPHGLRFWTFPPSFRCSFGSLWNLGSCGLARSSSNRIGKLYPHPGFCPTPCFFLYHTLLQPGTKLLHHAFLAVTRWDPQKQLKQVFQEKLLLSNEGKRTNTESREE